MGPLPPESHYRLRVRWVVAAVINGNVHPFSVNPGDPAEQLYTETYLPLDTVTLSIATNSPTPGPTTGYDIIHNNGSITLNSDLVRRLRCFC